MSVTGTEGQRRGWRETGNVADVGQTWGRRRAITSRGVGVMGRWARDTFSHVSALSRSGPVKKKKIRKETAAMRWGGEGTRTDGFFLAFVALSNARGAEMQARSPRDAFPPISRHSARLLRLQVVASEPYLLLGP